MPGKVISHFMPVRVVETGRVYPSQKAAALALGIRHQAISLVLRGIEGRTQHRGYHFERVEVHAYFLAETAAELKETMERSRKLIERDITQTPGERKRNLARLDNLLAECDRHITEE
jgi:hypothetical protein